MMARHVDEAQGFADAHRVDAVAEQLAIVGALYEAAGSPHRWPAALAAMTRALGARAAILTLGTSDGRDAAFGVSTWCQPAGILGSEVASPDHDALGQSCGATAARSEVRGAEGGGDDPAARGLGRLVPTTVGHGQALGLSLIVSDRARATVWFIASRQRRFGPAERALLAVWEPHLRGALAIQQRLTGAASHGAIAQAFDRLALGVVIVDEELRPLLINRTARRILKVSDTISLALAGLQGPTVAGATKLRAAIRGTVGAAAASGHIQSVGLRLERTPNTRPLDVIVVSLKRSEWQASQQPPAIVFIADPERRQVAPERLLRELYGLSHAEARLAITLAAGMPLTATAAALGISRNTAHCQLTSVFAKTGTRTQAGLLRLLRDGPAAIRWFEDSGEYQPVNSD